MEQGVFICDIGGTNCRVSIYSFTKKASEKYSKIFKTDKIKDFSELLNKISKQTGFNCKAAIIASAGEVKEGVVKQPNSKFKTSEKELKKKCNFEDVIILNDFEAQAFALKYYRGRDLIKHGPGTETGNVLVIGAGTGLGMMHLTNLHNGKYRINPSEEGHNHIPSYFPIDKEFLKFAKGKKKALEYEDICSGRGLEITYKFLTKKVLTANQISSKALKGQKIPTQTMKMFFHNYAKIVHFFATRYRCDTIYISGGIAMKNLQFTNEEFFNTIGEKMHIRVVKNSKTRRSLAKYYFEYRKLDHTLQI